MHIIEPWERYLSKELGQSFLTAPKTKCYLPGVNLLFEDNLFKLLLDLIDVRNIQFHSFKQKEVR